MRKTGNRIRIIIHFVQSTSTTYKTALEHDAATTVLKVSTVFLGVKTSPLPHHNSSPEGPRSRGHFSQT